MAKKSSGDAKWPNDYQTFVLLATDTFTPAVLVAAFVSGCGQKQPALRRKQRSLKYSPTYLLFRCRLPSRM